MLLLRMQEIQDETTKATRIDHVTAAKNRYMESVTNVKSAETRYVKAVFFGVHFVGIRRGCVSRFVQHVKKLAIIYKRKAKCGSVAGAIDKPDIS